MRVVKNDSHTTESSSKATFADFTNTSRSILNCGKVEIDEAV